MKGWGGGGGGGDLKTDSNTHCAHGQLRLIMNQMLHIDCTEPRPCLLVHDAEQTGCSTDVDLQIKTTWETTSFQFGHRDCSSCAFIHKQISTNID